MSEDTVYRQEASFSSGEWQQEAFQLAGVVRVATQECLILYKTLFKGYEKNGCVFPAVQHIPSMGTQFIAFVVRWLVICQAHKCLFRESKESPDFFHLEGS